MKLTKKVPARTVTEEFLWCKKDFMGVSFYNNSRKKYGMSLAMRCYWCWKPFFDDDMLALACPKKGLNRLLCAMCANAILNQEAEKK